MTSFHVWSDRALLSLAQLHADEYMSGSTATKRNTPRHQQRVAWGEEAEARPGAKPQPRGSLASSPDAAASSAGFLYDWVLAPLSGLVDRAWSQQGSPRGMVSASSASAASTPAKETSPVELEDVEAGDVAEAATAKSKSAMPGPSTSPSGKGGAGAHGRNRLDARQKTVRQIGEQYETSPFEVWFGILAKLITSALGTSGYAIATVLYPLYALTPLPVLDALSRGIFNIGYLIYMSALGRWLHLRMVRSMRSARRRPHSRRIQPSVLSSCSILPIPFLNDNYSYLLVDHATREAAAIDPADPYALKDIAKRLSLKLTTILTTHKHHDHAGGNYELQKACGGQLRVYGHVKDSIPGVTHLIKGGDTLTVGNTEVGVVHVPCHTTGHVVFAVLGNKDANNRANGSSRAGGDDGGGGAGLLPLHCVEALFTGDAIINGGVGAFFHGGPQDCYENLHVRLAGMPDAALIFSGHEYMLMNLRFAKWLDEDDEATAAALREVIVRRHHHLSTQPSSLKVERKVNPYFRIKHRVFLDKVLELQASIEVRKRKRWYQKYIPKMLASWGGKKNADGGGVFSGVSVGQSLGDPTMAECVQGIKMVQDLVQYRHLLDQSSGLGVVDDVGNEGEGDVEDGRGCGTPAMRTPSPGPVSTGQEMESESDDDTGAGLWGGRRAAKHQVPAKRKHEPPPELKTLLNNL